MKQTAYMLMDKMKIHTTRRTRTAGVLLLFLAVSLQAALPSQTGNFASPAYWAMAHSGGAVTENGNGYWLNPALPAYHAPYSIHLNEAFLPGTGIFISELSGHYTLKEDHLLHAGLNFENYGRFEARDPEGIYEGEFTAAQYQVFFGYSYRISPHFRAGLQTVFQGNRIESSRDGAFFLRYGLSYSFGKRDNMLAFAGITDGLTNRWRASFSHELEYLPLRLNIDLRWRGDDWDPAALQNTDGDLVFGTAMRYFAEKLSLGAYIRATEDLRIMAGIDLARLGMQTNAFGVDTILRGMALGGKYRRNSLEISLGLYHYANFTTMTALGVSYYGKRED